MLTKGSKQQDLHVAVQAITMMELLDVNTTCQPFNRVDVLTQSWSADPLF
jgi:hypothetical protein